MSVEINNNSQQNRIDKLEAMLFANPQDCFLLHALGLEYLKLENTLKAIDYFRKVLETDENYVGTYYHLAKTYEKINLREEAITSYKKGIEIAMKMKDAHARNELAMALEELEE